MGQPITRSTGRSGVELDTERDPAHYGNVASAQLAAPRVRRVLMMAPGHDADARCSHCGHPQREHRGQNPCSVPKCACSGYLARESGSARTKKRS